MTYRVILQPRAERDLLDSARYILGQSKSPAVALRWARGIRVKIGTLKTQPLRCPIDPDSDVYGVEVRIMLFGRGRGKYRVLFTIQADTVIILTVRHSARRGVGEQSGESEDS